MASRVSLGLPKLCSQELKVLLVAAFAPFVFFSVLTGVSLDLALWASFAAAFAVAIRDFVHSRELRLLEAGAMVLFGLLALYVGFIEPDVKVQIVRLVANCAFLFIALASIILRNPFTLRYARESADQGAWDTAEFRHRNYWLTGIWALAFLLMGLTDAASLRFPRFALPLDLAAGLAILIVAIVVTVRSAQKFHR